MDGPRDYLTEWSKSDRERQISYDITYMQNLKKWYKWSSLQNRNRLTDLENKLRVTQVERWGEKHKLGVWDWHIHTTVYKIDNQQEPTYSTGNSTQYSVITYMGKESEKEWIYVYV